MKRKKLIENVDFVVRSLPLPSKSFDGCVVANEEGCHTIVINESVCKARQRAALKHELYHIENDDLYNDTEDTESIEGRNPY